MPQAPKALLLTRTGSPGAPPLPPKELPDPDTSGGVPPQPQRAASPAQPPPPYEPEARYAPLIPPSGSSYRPPVPPKPWLSPKAADNAQAQRPGVALLAQPSPPYELDAGYVPLSLLSGSSYRPPVPPKPWLDPIASGGAQSRLPGSSPPVQQPVRYELEAVPASMGQQWTPPMQTSGPDAYRRDGPFGETSLGMPVGHEGARPPYRAQTMLPGRRVSTVEQYPVDIDFEPQERKKELGPVFSPGLEAFGDHYLGSSRPHRLTEPGRLRGAMRSLRSGFRKLFFPFSPGNPDRLKKYE
ncbi:hypothetical protein N0A02_27185 [Paraburkholderia acidicola]|uniref:Uncharacterized protein n=1 Tax=Paraburkholderia acidicola TaxID=1912599 RepID=A0ABV1LWI0_9BURK